MLSQGDFIGISVRPVKPFSMGVMLFPDSPLGERRYGPDDTFVVEHDFRYAGDTIHVGCPNGSWAEFSSEAFAEAFGKHALSLLDAIAAGSEGSGRD